MLLSDFLVRYFVTWVAFLVLAALVAFRTVRLNWRAELAFLTVRWKLMVFVPAILFTTFAGRFTDDETWDVVCGGGMALLTFLTSGWVVGTLYKVARRERPLAHALVAIALLFFSTAWFYDGYLLWRDGAYTVRWLGNLKLSPFAYLSAGVLLNVEAREGAMWPSFAFTRADWPRPLNQRVSLAMVALGVPLVAIAIVVLVGFVRWSW